MARGDRNPQHRLKVQKLRVKVPHTEEVQLVEDTGHLR